MEIENWPEEAQKIYEELQNEFEELDDLIYDHNSDKSNPNAWFAAIKKLPHLANLVECLEIEYQKVKNGREIVN